MNAIYSPFEIFALMVSIAVLAAVVIDHVLSFDDPEKSLVIQCCDRLAETRLVISERLDDAFEALRILRGGTTGLEAKNRRMAAESIHRELASLLDLAQRFRTDCRLTKSPSDISDLIVVPGVREMWPAYEREFEKRIERLDRVIKLAESLPSTHRFAEEIRSAQDVADRTAGAVCRISRRLGHF